MVNKSLRSSLMVPALVVLAHSLAAGQAPARAAGPANATAAAPVRAGVPLPAGYVIGAEDVLSVVYWREKDWSADTTVRPDGKISLPVLNDVQAAGLTPEELADAVKKAAAKYITGADVTVIVKEIRSRKVYVVGEVGKPGSYPLTSTMTVLQIIAEAGGLLEHSKRNDIAIVRTENGRERRFKFNYSEVVKGQKPEQNITLQPGDTVIVR